VICTGKRATSSRRSSGQLSPIWGLGPMSRLKAAWAGTWNCRLSMTRVNSCAAGEMG
jgi:hypothetical protein